MKRPVLILGDPLLRRKCAPVEDFSDPLLNEEMEDLREALERFRPGDRRAPDRHPEAAHCPEPWEGILRHSEPGGHLQEPGNVHPLG